MASSNEKAVYEIQFGKPENKDRKVKLKEFKVAVCAMLNTSGGEILVKREHDSNAKVFELLEESLTLIIGKTLTVKKINFIQNPKSIIVLVEKNTDFLVTTNYNLYLPGEKQVMQVPACEPLENVLGDIIKRTIVEEPVKPLKPHAQDRQKFFKGKHCGFYESKTIQLKNIKAEKLKKKTLASRMTGPTNKFSLYVSAFANYRGGYIYFGINDDGVIEGEVIRTIQEQEKVINSVENTFKKLIWPDEIVPKRGEHWEICFETVLNENSESIPSTFVIVVYIAHCFGGVFTKEPECYEMVGNKPQKMSFASWTKAILQPIRLPLIEIPQSVHRIAWSSTKTKELFTIESEDLRTLINNGDWDMLFKKCKVLKKETKLHLEKTLLALLQEGRAYCRKGELGDARFSLEKYNKILWEKGRKDRSFFEVMGLYLEAAIARASSCPDQMKDILDDALSKAELIQPGLVTATVYVFAGTGLTSVATDLSSNVLNIGLEHIKHIPDQYHVRADMERRAYMNLVMFILGYNINEQCTITKTSRDTLKKAKKCLRAIDASVREGQPFNKYHDAQYNVLLSVYKYQQSKISKPDEKGITSLRNAFKNAHKAKRLAEEGKFAEIERWSSRLETMCTEEIRISEKTESSTKLPPLAQQVKNNVQQNKSSPKKGKSTQGIKFPSLVQTSVELQNKMGVPSHE